jgi:hypothetical protein
MIGPVEASAQRLDVRKQSAPRRGTVSVKFLDWPDSLEHGDDGRRVCISSGEHVSVEEESDPDEDQTSEDRLIEALDRGDAAKAAAILRGLDALSKRVREALADMLDGDPNTNEYLRKMYPHHLQLTRWPGKGRPRRSILDLHEDMKLHRKVTAVVRKKKISPSAAFHEIAKALPKGGFATVRDAYGRADKRLIKFKK